MIIVLSKKKTDSRPLHEWLKEVDEPIAVLHQEQHETHAGMARSDGKFELVPIKSYTNSGEVEAVVHKLSQANHISKIISFAESDVVRAAQARQALGLAGQSVQSAIAYRDKYEMKNALFRTGIPSPMCAPLNTVLDALEFADNYGWPIIIKPKRLAGSLGIAILHSANELEDFCRQADTGIGSISDFIVEQYVQIAKMYHVDGLMKNGAVHWHFASEYLCPPLDAIMRKNPIVGGVNLVQSAPKTQKIVSLVKDAIAVLPAPPDLTSFHAEVFEEENSNFLICEIASRTPGGRVPEMIKYLTGIDLERETARGQVCLPEQSYPPYHDDKFCAYIMIPPQEGRLKQLPENCPFCWVPEFEILANTGQTFQDVKKSTEQIGWALIEGSTREELNSRISQFDGWIQDNIAWSKRIPE